MGCGLAGGATENDWFVLQDQPYSLGLSKPDLYSL